MLRRRPPRLFTMDHVMSFGDGEDAGRTDQRQVSANNSKGKKRSYGVAQRGFTPSAIESILDDQISELEYPSTDAPIEVRLESINESRAAVSRQDYCIRSTTTTMWARPLGSVAWLSGVYNLRDFER